MTSSYSCPGRWYVRPAITDSVERDRAANLLGALAYLGRTRSSVAPLLLVEVALHGGGSVKELANRLQLPTSSVSDALRKISIGRYIRAKDPQSPGRVIPPPCPALLHIARSGQGKELLVTLTDRGWELMRMLLGQDLPSAAQDAPADSTGP